LVNSGGLENIPRWTDYLILTLEQQTLGKPLVSASFGKIMNSERNARRAIPLRYELPRAPNEASQARLISRCGSDVLQTQGKTNYPAISAFNS
jgi:hypothetical protein